jgi:hypothetical protein
MLESPIILLDHDEITGRPISPMMAVGTHPVGILRPMHLRTATRLAEIASEGSDLEEPEK